MTRRGGINKKYFLKRNNKYNYSRLLRCGLRFEGSSPQWTVVTWNYFMMWKQVDEWSWEEIWVTWYCRAVSFFEDLIGHPQTSRDSRHWYSTCPVFCITSGWLLDSTLRPSIECKIKPLQKNSLATNNVTN